MPIRRAEARVALGGEHPQHAVRHFLGGIGDIPVGDDEAGGDAGIVGQRPGLGGGGAGPVAAEDIGGVSFIGKVLDGVGGKELRGLAEEFKKQAGVVAIVGTADGKAAVAVAVAPDLTGLY